MSDSNFIQSVLANKLFAQKRVLYSAGQLLGVSEFSDEQRYLLDRHNAHQLFLHGYGTVAGLAVGMSETKDGDLEIAVEAGLGVDRLGRTFAVTPRQCSSLRAWLSAHQDFKGTTLYVTGRYDEMGTDRVSLVGQACSNDSVVAADSRIKDSFRLELSADPPPMPAWGAVHAFSRLLAALVLAEKTDETAAKILSEALSSLEALRKFSTELAGKTLNVSEETLGEVFRAWVLRLLPEALKAELETLNAPTASPDTSAILLAQVSFNRGRKGNDEILTLPDAPTLPVDERRRPYLLHTGLIQELPRGGSAPANTPDPSEALKYALRNTHILPLVTITPLGLDEKTKGPVFELWFHLDIADKPPTASLNGVPRVHAYLETEAGNFTPVELALAPDPAKYKNVYIGTLQPVRGSGVYHLRFVVPMVDNTVIPVAGGDAVSLFEFMWTHRTLFEGTARFEGYGDVSSQPAVVTYVRATTRALTALGTIEANAPDPGTTPTPARATRQTRARSAPRTSREDQA